MNQPEWFPTDQHGRRLPQAEWQIALKVRDVERREECIGVLSTGEQIAVALVLDRADLLRGCGYRTILAAVDRLGDSWLEAAIRVQREEGWRYWIIDGPRS